MFWSVSPRLGFKENIWPNDSVHTGDRILVQPHDAPPGKWFEGAVHFVRRESVGLRFHASFHWSEGQRYNVRFKLNRYPLRRQHQGLDTVFTQERVLMPTPNHIQTPYQSDLRLRIFNKLIASNAPQLQAVNSIIQQKPGDVPFVVFGP